MPALIIHGHFYQPPRENPWTGMVDSEPSAAPFHDWNERIHSECYRSNAFVRVAGSSTVAERIVNNYGNISFNFGPTLLSWLESNHPDTCSRVIDADRESALKRGGHGNAIAQAYGHPILPLCNARDLRTQIHWGMADFRQRFRREPEAMWLPETACNDAVMSALIDQGLRVVILAPHQASRCRTGGRPGSLSGQPAWGGGCDRVASSAGGSEWQSVADQSIDMSVPSRYVHPDGSDRSIPVFFYDDTTAPAIASA